MDSIGLRIKELREAEGLTQTEFCAIIGAKQSNLSAMENTGKKISVEIISSILLKFDISADWLILGVGLMKKQKANYESNNIILPAPVLQDSPVQLRLKENIIQIPVFDAAFAAGLSGCINGTKPDVEEYLAIPQTMLRRGAVYAGIRSKGHSMSPTIFDSDRLIVRLLDKGEWMDMRDEHVYAIIDNESRGFLKRVKNRFNQGFIVCMSDNIDKINYPNFTMQADEVVSIWHADLHVSALMPNINETYYSRLKRLEDKVDVLSNKLL
jgi:Predicted transcriptional regulator